MSLPSSNFSLGGVDGIVVGADATDAVSCKKSEDDVALCKMGVEAGETRSDAGSEVDVLDDSESSACTGTSSCELFAAADTSSTSSLA